MQFYLRNNVFKNNIVYIGDSNQALRSRSGRMDSSTPTVTFDHNLYYSPAGANGVKWSLDGKDYSSFEAYVKATGEDHNSKFADPKFVDANTHNFHLQQDSPAIGAGVDLGKDIVGSDDLDGHPRCPTGKIDVGCYQQK